MSFSRASLSAIEGFAAGLGLPARPARDGSFTFLFADRGALTLTASRDGRWIVASLAQRPVRRLEDCLGPALARAGFDPTIGAILHAGLTRDDQLVFSVAIEDEACDLPMLETCLQGLSAAHRGLR